MRAERVVGYDRGGDEVGPLRFDACVDVRSIVAVRPTVKGAFAHRRHVVWYEVAPQLVALVDRDPERAGFRFPRKTDGIAHSIGKDAVSARRGIDLPDRGALLFSVDAMLRGVAVRTDADIELRSTGVGEQAFRPMMVVRPAGKRGDGGRRRGDARIAIVVRVADEGVRVGDVECVAN